MRSEKRLMEVIYAWVPRLVVFYTRRGGEKSFVLIRLSRTMMDSHKSTETMTEYICLPNGIVFRSREI